jgi:hypothetical protein
MHGFAHHFLNAFSISWRFVSLGSSGGGSGSPP